MQGGDDGGFKAYSSSRSSALSGDLEHIEGLARSHEQAVALGAAETQIGTNLGQSNAADQLGRGVEHEHTGVAEWRIGAAPQIARDIGAHAVRTAFDPVH